MISLPVRERLQPLQIYQLLPGTNCKRCGLPGCMAFAFSLAAREKGPADCPELECFPSSAEILNQYFGGNETPERTGLLIDRERCNGCGDCVLVCNKQMPSVASHEMGVYWQKFDFEIPSPLQVVDGTVKVVNWTSCKRCAEPPLQSLGCRVCADKCPFGALELLPPVKEE